MSQSEQQQDGHAPVRLAELSREQLVALAKECGIVDAQRMTSREIVLTLRHHRISGTSNPMPGAMPKV